MKRLGIIVLVVAGFVGGIAFVYSCGGGGSDVFAAGDADTLDGLHASDFASSTHSHPGLPTGVHWIGAAEFQESDSDLNVSGQHFGAYAHNTVWPAKAWGPISIPFQCTITEILFRLKNDNDSDLFFGIYDGGTDASDYYKPIVEKTITEGNPSGEDYVIYSIETIGLEYNPSTFKKPWWIRVEFNDSYDNQRIQWVKMYYTIP